MSIYDEPSILVFCVIVAAALGAVMGSFLNCAAWRIVHGESFLKGRSHCPSCGHTLGASELIPVISFLIQKGRCRKCGVKLSARYPVTELICAGLTVLCLIRFDLSVLGLRNYALICCLFLLTLTDIEDMTIPDGCHIAAVIAWIAAAPFIFPGWGEALMNVAAGAVYGGGLLVISLIMDKVLGRDSMGGGDIKLFAVAGLYLGFIGTLFALLIACAAGLIFRAVGRSKDEEKEFPFGPWIALGTAAVLFFGEPLIAWYSGLLGL